jgi:hypothetical protein
VLGWGKREYQSSLADLDDSKKKLALPKLQTVERLPILVKTAATIAKTSW